MATLYRIIDRPTLAKAPGETGIADQMGDYLAKTVAHIPAEVISVFLIGKAFLSEPKWAKAFMIWTVFCWVMTVAIRWTGTKKGPGKALNVILSGIAFPIWVLAIGGTVVGIVLEPEISSIIVLGYTLLAALLYNIDKS